MTGFIVLYTQSKPAAGYAGAVLAAMGIYPTIPIAVTWAGSTSGGDVAKGVAIAMVLGAGNLGAICSSFIYIKPSRFYVGHGIILGWLGLAVLLSCFAMWDYTRLNGKKKVLCDAQGIDETRREEFKNMGNESPLFRGL
ncbi:hypothetical protein H0H81_007659 [Sphagnurus paluster]|uniref:Uncharacterized protein n=1 Tax=Sphagnurus paluster TaxID=117069 RepID=A0A9P7K7M6_9AGAR|nr:hypothetical protein H0H81_007659 [Sphagnurus paluster]